MQGDAEPAGEMVVAGARRRKRRARPGARPVARSTVDGERHQRFDRMGDRRSREPVVAVAPLGRDDDELARHEPSQMPARRLRRDAGHVGKLLCGQRAPVEEGSEDVGPCRIAHQRRGFGEKRFGSTHASIGAKPAPSRNPECYGQSRSVP